MTNENKRDQEDAEKRRLLRDRAVSLLAVLFFIAANTTYLTLAWRFRRHESRPHQSREAN